MIPVSAALDALFALAHQTPEETVPLPKANGRVLLKPARATRSQPPFDASAMDGYAVAAAQIGDRFLVTGEAAAGRGYSGTVGPGDAIRIFTGAPVPNGATRVVIQEDVDRTDDTVTIARDPGKATHIRLAGKDFSDGDTLSAPRRLTAHDIALLAAMNIPAVTVARRPKVAILATGDELVMPGETPGPDQIVASNTFGLHALLQDAGAEPRLLPIARDTLASIKANLDLADDADLILTIGGASVGDHDLVAAALADLGMTQAFHKVAMRPGKPLMSGTLNGCMMIGLPGNPVSAMVCGHIFVLPVIRKMLGLGAHAAPRAQAELSHDLPENGPREHYMRASVTAGMITVSQRQDSSLLSVLNQSNALAVRAPGAPAAKAGDRIDYISLS